MKLQLYIIISNVVFRSNYHQRAPDRHWTVTRAAINETRLTEGWNTKFYTAYVN